MRYAIVLAILLGAVGSVPWAMAGGPKCCSSEPGCSAEGCQPQGGWHPYGGGLLNWWPRCCFPSCWAPDDYCRKPLPCVRWPPYPSYYTVGLPDMCCGDSDCE
jgi:hypothetical protein